MSEPSKLRTDCLGVVVIGRNEGERLRRCLESLQGTYKYLVYVDSGSSDDSVSMSRKLGADVVALDTTLPFTAARARNMGFERLREIGPDLEYIQFVDGDCEIVAGWMAAAVGFLDNNPQVAVACGRRKERYPRKTVYNWLCDMEWNSPLGETAACGGDSLIRTKTLLEVGVFDPTLIAGEEPEMCYRFRQKGWKIYRLDHDMTLHDAEMTHFSQWWKRTLRSGHAYAEGHARHGKLFGGYCARNVRSILVWGLFVPVIGIVPVCWTRGASLLVFFGYAVLWSRIRKYRISRGDGPRDAMVYANFCVLGKFPELLGVMKYWKNRLLGRRSKIIEYKG